MTFFIVALIFLTYRLVRFLRLFVSCDSPVLSHQGGEHIAKTLKRCPSLTQVYSPPKIWGKCGHFQTAFYGKIGRWNAPKPEGNRYFKLLPSGETFTYDIFQPVKAHHSGLDCTILLCPGIANSSEKAYVRTFTHYAMHEGYRVAVLNHIGSLANVKLTSPKIFTYGDTKYFSSMVSTVIKLYPNSSFVMLGYSMGANIAMKYLGEDVKRQENIICAISLCQGYDAIRSTEPLRNGYRKFYDRMITMNLKNIIRPHWDVLFNNMGNGDSCYDGDKVKLATSMHEIEDGLFRHFDGHSCVQDYMDKSSCCHVINNVKIPVLLVNSDDDPVVVNDVHDIPKSYSESVNPQAIFARFKFGGHLGYYTGSWYRPNDESLLEKLVIEYFDANIDMNIGKLKKYTA